MPLPKTIVKKIKIIPGAQGFWSSGSEKTFIEVGEKLVDKGFSEGETVDILSTLYFATANCYGN